MKLLAFASSSAILVAAVAHQEPAPTFPEPLATDFAKLSAAKSLKVHLTKRILGEAPKEVTLEFGKDKKFKVADADGVIVSDGTTLTVYNKTKNTYSQDPLTPATLAKFQKRIEVFGWASFLQTKPGSELATATAGPNTNVKGKDLESVNVTVKPDGHAATYLIDPANGVTVGASIKSQGKDYLVIADSVQLGTDPLPDTDFAFTPPDGATLAKSGGDPGTFADVQSIVNDACMPCHSADHKRAGVDLSSYDGIAATVTPGQSAASLLVKAVTGNGVDLMPKGRGPLTSDQIASISKWIDDGAKNQ